MSTYKAYVGLDVHKDTIANRRSALRRVIDRLAPTDEALSFCHEAGPCGYGVYREFTEWGYHGDVVAPGLVPKGATDRVKTDRRDALKLARLHRAGELTPVWVSGPEQEAMRNLTRAREDMKALQTKVRQRLGAFLVRYARVYPGKSRWTPAHKAWLSDQSFDTPVQPLVFQEYVDACHETSRRVAGLDELGDITRFDNPGQLVSFLGLVPSEHSSGARRRTGAGICGLHLGDHLRGGRPPPRQPSAGLRLTIGKTH